MAHASIAASARFFACVRTEGAFILRRGVQKTGSRLAASSQEPFRRRVADVAQEA